MKRSKFNLSHTQLLTGRMGQLIPIGLVEVLPGDTIQHAAQALIRAAPLATPPMHPVRIDIRHFFVPNRILWDGWEDFITGGPDGNNTDSPPYMNAASAIGSLQDFFGIPPGNTLDYSALPFRAYNMIFNEYYRDQDLQEPLAIAKTSAFDDVTETELQNICWEKDYFTTARPWEQKGPTVTLPIGSTAPVVINQIRNVGLNQTRDLEMVAGEDGGGGNQGMAAGSYPGAGWNQQDVAQLLGTVDLSSATAATVNDLRLALSLQRYQEARARFGSRYTEYLAYLGITSSDARLQRPEYLGGARTNLQFSEVLSSDVDTTDPNDPRLPGVFGGHGIGANRTNIYRRFFEEHGWIISLMAVQPQTMYPDGLFRHWYRRTKEDYFQKELQHIGQQEILNRELTAFHTNPFGVFGYQDRYDEYRRSESQVHGYFRRDSYLNDWHFARNVPNNVALNADFVRSQPTDIPFQVRTIGEAPAATLYVAVRHQMVARRLLAKKGSSFIL